MSKILRPLLVALALTGCQPSPPIVKIQEPVRLSCADILADAVMPSQVHDFVYSSEWAHWQELMTILALEKLIENSDGESQFSTQGKNILDKQYAELQRLETGWQDLSSYQLTMLQKKHLNELLLFFFENGYWRDLFPNCAQWKMT